MIEVSTSLPSGRNAVFHTAQIALAFGISVIPVRADGSKQPALASWSEFQKRRASTLEVEHWFRCREVGIAFITGAVSSNLEAIDFDDFSTYQAWQNHVRQDPVLSPIARNVSWGYLEATPSGGRHLLYRCEEDIEGNQKLACCLDSHGRRKTLIETRGERGLIIVAPSGRKVHHSGQPYVLQLGRISLIRTITADQRRLLLDSARQFDEIPDKAERPLYQTKMPSVLSINQERPGDRFNRVASWEEVLCPHGWQFVRTVGEECYWRRPGKRGPGISATTNYQGTGLLYVFSTSTDFESEQTYSKFAAYTLLNHGGNYTAAARALAKYGY